MNTIWSPANVFLNRGPHFGEIYEKCPWLIQKICIKIICCLISMGSQIFWLTKNQKLMDNFLNYLFFFIISSIILKSRFVIFRNNAEFANVWLDYGFRWHSLAFVYCQTWTIFLWIEFWCRNANSREMEFSYSLYYTTSTQARPYVCVTLVNWKQPRWNANYFYKTQCYRMISLRHTQEK